MLKCGFNISKYEVIEIKNFEAFVLREFDLMI